MKSIVRICVIMEFREKKIDVCVKQTARAGAAAEGG